MYLKAQTQAPNTSNWENIVLRALWWLDITVCFTVLGKLNAPMVVRSSKQFLQLPQLFREMKFTLKVVKIDSKIIANKDLNP
jgi:hypothetical protein